MKEACAGASDRHVALQSFPGVPSPVWVMGFPKGRRGAAHNLDEVAVGSAEPLTSFVGSLALRCVVVLPLCE